MHYKNILITGGCGFVGSNLASRLKKEFPEAQVTSFDNFSRLGSELNKSRLEKLGIRVVEGDVRDREKILSLPYPDLIIDCAAEPSVLAGRDGNPLYVTDVNLGGTLNTLELSRISKADFIFLSTSRVYPVDLLQSLPFEEEETRFALKKDFSSTGVSVEGIAEDFPLGESRTLYGATKLSSEFFVKEFIENFGIRAVINRFGVIAGPWQFGKVDQGFVTLWLSKHMFNAALSYIGFGGEGKQVRDVLHVDDLCDAIILQMNDMDKCSGEIYNIGGGKENSISLLEMTKLCEEVTGNTIAISKVKENRQGDIAMYVSDSRKFKKKFGWMPKRTIKDILGNTYSWIQANEEELKKIFN